MNHATKTTDSTFGMIAGLAGLEHGIGEILQGSRAPESIVFLSWPESRFFAVLAGEPALSLIPNLLLSGILTIVITLVFTTWAIFFIQRKNGGLVLIALSAILLVVGGGFGPPLLGFILGAAAHLSNASQTGWRTRLPSGLRNSAKKSWGWFYGIGIIAWLLVLPGLSILDTFFFIVEVPIISTVILLAFGTLLLAIVTGLVSPSMHPSGQVSAAGTA